MCASSPSALHLSSWSDCVCYPYEGGCEGVHCGLQRQNHNPEVQHVRRLNKLLRWVQRNPKKLACKKLSSWETHLRIISDAAFKKETEKGHCLRGALYLRAPGDTTASFVTTRSMFWTGRVRVRDMWHAALLLHNYSRVVML